MKNSDDLNLAEEYLREQQVQGKSPGNLTIVRPEILLAKISERILEIEFDLISICEVYKSDSTQIGYLGKSVEDHGDFSKAVQKYKIHSDDTYIAAICKLYAEEDKLYEDALNLCNQAVSGARSRDVFFIVRPESIIPEIEKIIAQLERRLRNIESIIKKLKKIPPTNNLEDVFIRSRYIEDFSYSRISYLNIVYQIYGAADYRNFLASSSNLIERLRNETRLLTAKVMGS